jgi:hypothetical protein
MKIQECRWPERDRHPMKPARPNPKRTERSDQAIQDAQIWGTPARTIQDQQLMFRENGFCDRGAHTARPTDAHNRGEHMDKEDNQITHVRF